MTAAPRNPERNGRTVRPLTWRVGYYRHSLTKQRLKGFIP